MAQHRFPGDGEECPPPDIYKRCPDTVLGNLLKVDMLEQGETRPPLEVLTNIRQSMIK